MSSRKIFLFILILCAGCLLAAYLIIRPSGNIYCLNESAANIFSSDKLKTGDTDFPFRPGELIEYEVRLNFLRFGKASLTYNGAVVKNDAKALSISFLVDVVNFEDLEQIYADFNTFNPLWVKREIKFINRDEFINEDYASKPNCVKITKYKNDKIVSSREIKSDSSFQNVIAGIYYCRKLKELRPGEKFALNLPLNKLELQVKGIQDIKLASGKFKAYYIESIPRKYRFWLSADKKRIPLKVEGAISFSPAAMMMTTYKEGVK